MPPSALLTVAAGIRWRCSPVTNPFEGIQQWDSRELTQRSPNIPCIAEQLFHAHKFLADPNVESGVLAIWDGTAYALPSYASGDYFRSKYTASRRGLSRLIYTHTGTVVLGGVLDNLIIELLRLCREHGRVWTSGAGSGLYHGTPHAVFANGLVDTTTGDLRKHDPDFFVAGQFPVAYTDNVPQAYEQWVKDRGLESQLDRLEAWSATMFDSTYVAPRIMTLTGDAYEAGKSSWLDIMMSAASDGDHNDVRTPPTMFLGKDSVRTDKWRTKGLPAHEVRRLQHAVLITKYNTKLRDIRSARIRNFALSLPSSALCVAEIVGEGWNTYEYMGWKKRGYSPDLEVFTFDQHVAQQDWDIREKVLPGERDAIASRWIRTLARVGRPQ